MFSGIIGSDANGDVGLTKVGLDGEIIETIALSPEVKTYETYIYVSRIGRMNDGGYVVSVDYDMTDAKGEYHSRSRIIKLNADLKEQWKSDIDGDAFSIEPTNDGGTIIAARTGLQKLGLTKLSPNGKTTWTRIYEPEFSRSYFQIEPKQVIQTVDGGYLTVGDASSTGQQISYMLKVDSNGNRLWEHTLYSAGSGIEDIALNDQYQYAVTGNSSKYGAFVMQWHSDEKPPIRVEIDGEPLALQQPPVVQSGTTLLPMRDLFEALGATVHYDQATKSIKAVKGARTILLVVGQPSVAVTEGDKSRTIELSVPAQFIGTKTMVPLRFASEALGNQIIWNSAEQLIEVELSANE